MSRIVTDLETFIRKIREDSRSEFLKEVSNDGVFSIIQYLKDKSVIDIDGRASTETRINKEACRLAAEYLEIYNLKIGGFSTALEIMKAGGKMARRGWNGKGIYVTIHHPDSSSEITTPFLCIVTTGLITDNPDAPKCVTPWSPSQTDLLADDWYVVED